MRLNKTKPQKVLWMAGELFGSYWLITAIAVAGFDCIRQWIIVNHEPPRSQPLGPFQAISMHVRRHIGKDQSLCYRSAPAKRRYITNVEKSRMRWNFGFAFTQSISGSQTSSVLRYTMRTSPVGIRSMSL
jgi:hypothetical protein